jgi:steroid 5-alpha reductase family enzyme
MNKMIVEYIRRQLTIGSDIEALAMLSFVAICTVMPLSLFGRKSFAFSVGYGASIGAMALALLCSFDTRTPDVMICYGTFIYGVRLASFLLWRRAKVKGMAAQTRTFDEKPALKLIPLITFLGVLYAFMVSPVLFLLRDKHDHNSNGVTWLGLITLYTGLWVEAVADHQKLSTKHHHKTAYDGKDFVGPTDGLYSWCRHPNYFGEVIFWLGVWLAGVSSYHTGFVRWAVSTMGACAIFWIMNGSAARLDKKQAEKYGGQHQFDEWKRNVPGSLMPHVFRFRF